MNANEKISLKQWNFAKLQRYQVSGDGSVVHLGLPTWEESKYKGTIYDPRSPENEYLAQYAGQFDTVELRQTFTEFPNPYDISRLKGKVEKINPNFKFCPIIPRVISHETGLSTKTPHLQKLFYSFESFENHIGTCILQLPENFSTAQSEILKNFLAQWPEHLPILIDFRHKSWLSAHGVVSSLKRKDVGILITDDLGMPDMADKLLCGENLGVRFIGRYKHGQDEQRLALWVYRMNEYRAMGIKNSFFFLHEEEEMCLGILRKMANSLGGQVRVPQGFDVKSDQLELF